MVQVLPDSADLGGPARNSTGFLPGAVPAGGPGDGSEWGESENKRKAKFYRLTADGKRQLQNEEKGNQMTEVIAGICKRRRRSCERLAQDGVVDERKSAEFHMESEMDAEMRFHEAYVELGARRDGSCGGDATGTSGIWRNRAKERGVPGCARVSLVESLMQDF
jgi:hypothetical protein